MKRTSVFLLLTISLAAQDDPRCPAYPSAARTEALTRLELDWEKSTLSRRPRAAIKISLQRNNVIDEILFAQMEKDGVTPAALSSDAEFLRRTALQLTGRLPSPDEATRFLASPNRTAAIDRLLTSDAYVDQWTFYFMDRFKATSAFTPIGRPGNRVFYKFVREMVQSDRSWKKFATDVITASGDNYTAPVQFLTRQYAQDGATQDHWDNMADAVTSQFLGVTTQCISCHRGRGYLEKVNLFLSQKTRDEFWRLSAFFARTNLQFVATDAVNGGLSSLNLVDRDTGRYTGFVSPANPGIRPPRPAASYDPAYLFSAEQPATGAWRPELAHMVTGDRQFARAAVNYIWAAMFGYGIVDPPAGWDFRRTDPNNPPPEDWPMQNVQPELLEELTNRFIASDYSIKTLIRLIAQSTTYQLSSDYSGTWNPAYARYFARRLPLRMTAEQIYDAVVRATQTEVPLYIEDFDRIVYYANQLPDVTEPRFEGRVQNFLSLLGRGVWFGAPARTTRPGLLGALFMLNSNEVMSRAVAVSSGGFVALNRASRLSAQDLTDEELVRQLYVAALVRYPSADEVSKAVAAKGEDRALWISNLQWAVLNKLEFLFY